MASGTNLGHSGDADMSAFIDRWIYVFMAAFFIATTLVGFVPDSLMKIELVAAGKRPPFPPILHVHAVLMGAWLLLLLAQTTLMATGNRAHHMKLGIASFLLAPAIIVTGIILVPTIYGQLWNAAANASGDELARMEEGLAIRGNIALLQIRAGLLFAIFVVLGVRARKLDSGFHKRMMILATVVPMPASIDRITWLPATLPTSPMSADLYTLLWISPMFLWDLYRTKRVHKAYLVWFALWLPATVILHMLWSSAWWQATVPSLMGFG